MTTTTTTTQEAPAMPIAARLEHCAKFTGLDAVRELLQEAAQAVRKRDAVIKLLEGEAEALQAQAQVQGEPFAWVEHHKGGDNLVWDEPGGRKSPLYTTPQPAQATQAEVTDKLIAEAGFQFCSEYSADPEQICIEYKFTQPDLLEFASAILALRQAAVPMTEDQVWHNDALMSANGIAGFKMDALMRIVRAVESHHGITAQAKKEAP